MKLYRNDTINFLSKLTVRRVWNATKVISSFYLTQYSRKATQWGMPFTISLEPTTACNLRCPECPSGLRSFTRPTGMLQEQVFSRVIDQLSASLMNLTFYFQGEPYLNPKFLEMVQYASAKNVFTSTSTNAHYLSDEQAKRRYDSGVDLEDEEGGGYGGHHGHGKFFFVYICVCI